MSVIAPLPHTQLPTHSRRAHSRLHPPAPAATHAPQSGPSSSTSDGVRFPSSHEPDDDLPPQPRALHALRTAPSHARTRSASSAARALPKTPARTRAASTSGHSHTSLSLPRNLLPSPSPLPPTTSHTSETLGAFSPTSCPRQHLHSLLGTLPQRRRRTPLRLSFDFNASIESDAGTPPLSPIPSICRTPSSEDGGSTAPSSAGPATPVCSPVLAPRALPPSLHSKLPPHSRTLPSPPKAPTQVKALRPVLEALEDASRFRVRTACAACARAGSNFPCCPRCGEMWCSRACRLASNGGGKRHVCKSAA